MATLNLQWCVILLCLRTKICMFKEYTLTMFCGKMLWSQKLTTFYFQYVLPDLKK